VRAVYIKRSHVFNVSRLLVSWGFEPPLASKAGRIYAPHNRPLLRSSLWRSHVTKILDSEVAEKMIRVC